MTSRRLPATMIMSGVVAFVAGVYGVISPEVSIPLAGLGLLSLLFGAALFAWRARPSRLMAPHIGVVAVTLLGAALHAYENFGKSSGDLSVGFFVWAMVPYALCLAVSAFPSTKAPAVAGAVLAFIFDLWGHYSVFVNPQSSTAALALLFIPLWSTIIVVPLATFIAWSVQHRGRRSANAP
jgi:hypothetical protein